MTAAYDRPMTAAAPTRSLFARIVGFARRYVGEISRFLSVGAVAYVIDTGLFNLLRYGPGELLGDKPITAKVVSVTVATLASWVGNRYWTFALRRTNRPARELIAFVVVNGLSMAAAAGSLAFSHYVLGLTSPLADNISGNVVGTVLGTVIRYVAYRTVIFTGTGDRQELATEPAVEAAGDGLSPALPSSPPAT